MNMQKLVALLAWMVFAATTAAQESQTAPGVPPSSHAPGKVSPQRIHFVHMGGNDCPPCVAWRMQEYPKLQKLPAFQAIRYSHVTKTIRSPVPGEAFLPSELKPLKARLDLASGGRSGSPHQLILVDDMVYDYWFGPKDAGEIEARIAAIVAGTKYPGARCARRTMSRSCAEAY